MHPDIKKVDDEIETQRKASSEHLAKEREALERAKFLKKDIQVKVEK